MHSNLRGQVILVCDATGLQQAVCPILLRSRMCAVGLGHIEQGLCAIARQPEVGVIQDSEQLASRHAIALVVKHTLEARTDFSHDGHLGARVERSSQRQRFCEVARLTVAVRTGILRAVSTTAAGVSASVPAQAAVPRTAASTITRSRVRVVVSMICVSAVLKDFVPTGRDP